MPPEALVSSQMHEIQESPPVATLVLTKDVILPLTVPPATTAIDGAYFQMRGPANIMTAEVAIGMMIGRITPAAPPTAIGISALTPEGSHPVVDNRMATPHLILLNSYDKQLEGCPKNQLNGTVQ